MRAVSTQQRWRAAAVVLALAAIVAAAMVVRDVLGDDDPAAGSIDNGAATSVATVTRRSLSERTQLNGTLGYAGSSTVLGSRPGTVTWLPQVGQVIRQGQVLYRVDGAPVVLLYGTTPAYRTLAEGAYASSVAGRDVAQLNRDLVALGYLDAADVAAWDEFGWATRQGVVRLQDELGVEQTGALDLGDVVFLPTPARVTARRAGLGGPATGEVLSASSTVRTVTVQLDPSLQSTVRAGDRVTVTLPDGHATAGRISSVGRVALTPSNATGNPDDQGGSGPTIPVHLRLLHPGAAGTLDQALVEVAITDRTVHHVLTVPVTALLARAGGGYAVEVVDPDDSRRLVPVSTGLVDDAAGLVQVTGSGLSAGQHVVVPGDE